MTWAKVTEADEEEDDAGEGERSYLEDINAPNSMMMMVDIKERRSKGRIQKDRDFWNQVRS